MIDAFLLSVRCLPLGSRNEVNESTARGSSLNSLNLVELLVELRVELTIEVQCVFDPLEGECSLNRLGWVERKAPTACA
jgi:hypothetical protein